MAARHGWGGQSVTATASAVFIWAGSPWSRAPPTPTALPSPHPLNLATMAGSMDTAGALSLLQDVRGSYSKLADALEYVAAQSGKTVHAVRVAYYRSRGAGPRHHARNKLNLDQETILVSVAQAFSVNNAALSLVQLRQLVQRKFGVHVSPQWVARFIARHKKELSKRACKALADKRAGAEVFNGVVGFCEELQHFLERYHFRDYAVFNYDETRVVQHAGNMTLTRVEMAGKERANVRSTRHNTVATLLPFVSADGGVLLSVYILKGQFGEGSAAPIRYVMEQAPSITRGTWPRYYCWNDTGFLDADTFKAVLDKVADEWHTRHPGIPALLFGDQLASHRRADIVEHALGRGLYLFSLPKNASHFNQPLDASPFGTLQADKTHRNKGAMMDAILTNTSTWDTLLMAAYRAERHAFTRPVIKGAFVRCGVWPFDAKRMLANARANLGMCDQEETIVEAARSAAALVIQDAQTRVDSSVRGTVSGKAVVQKGVVHSPFYLIESQRKAEAEEAKTQQEREARRDERAKKKADREAKEAEKVATRENHRCRVCPDKVHRRGKTWTGCPCDAFWVCPPCAKTLPAGAAMAEHIKVCPGPAAVGSDSDSEDGGGSSSSVATE